MSKWIFNEFGEWFAEVVSIISACEISNGTTERFSNG